MIDNIYFLLFPKYSTVMSVRYLDTFNSWNYFMKIILPFDLATETLIPETYDDTKYLHI